MEEEEREGIWPEKENKQGLRENKTLLQFTVL